MSASLEELDSVVKLAGVLLDNKVLHMALHMALLVSKELPLEVKEVTEGLLGPKAMELQGKVELVSV